MKKSLLVLLAFISTGTFAAEPATPLKTSLNTTHSAQCDTPAAKLKKECAQTSQGTSGIHH